MSRRVVYVIVCGAGPAGNVGQLVTHAREAGWDAYLVPTDTARRHFLDVPALEELTGHPLRGRFRTTGEPGRLPGADAVIVAPATYNTINKWAAGIADTYPLTLLAELTGAGVPIIVLPYVNSAFAANRVFTRSLDELRAGGVTVLYGPGAFEPHPPRGGTIDTFPWDLAVQALDVKV
ncbi:flavoprotein [Pseudofrankia asymbiotica]|uniref:Flavoprotein n=1 Tax=Pseudofrankia asymbiotica TaxID=1834516 RepID=A0A1V2I4D0_9ACTN|nr:flavoprotein [Pseudofrankia asymbiotica]ONH25677.1 flavoprotein [Pseudofrankia asymbiotica]